MLHLCRHDLNQTYLDLTWDIIDEGKAHFHSALKRMKADVQRQVDVAKKEVAQTDLAFSNVPKTS